MIIKKYDFVVIGAGLSGMCAAVAAARNGLKVALIGDRPVVGGNASVEIGIDINGACYNSLYSPSVYARETGLIEELKQEIFHRAGYETFKSADYNGALLDFIYNEKKIDLYLNTYAESVDVQDGEVCFVECVQLTSERSYRFYGEYFADCSGDGIIGCKAGIKYIMGSEGKDEYGETLAPEKRTRFTNGSTLMFQTVRTGKEEKFIAPDFAYDITKLDFFDDLGTKNRDFYISKKVGGYQGFWWVEFGGHLNCIKDSEQITLELKKLVFGIWDYIKNSGKFQDVWDAKLISVGNVIGKRESRRFIGEYVISQKDILNKKTFDDACYSGGWPMDVHADYGIYDKGNATYWNFVPGLYNLPLKTLYSTRLKNLFFAGRITSCTRIANGSTRVMATCAAGGQAVGSAVALCKKNNLKTSDLQKDCFIKSLQRLLLRQDQTICGYKEQYEITNATVVASPSKILENVEMSELIPLEKNVVFALPVQTKSLFSVQIYIQNLAKYDVTLEYSVLVGNYKECYLPQERIKKAALTVEKGCNGFVTFDLFNVEPADGKIYIMLERNEHIAVGTSKNDLTGVPTFTAWEKQPDLRDCRKFVTTKQYYNVCFKNVLPEQANVFAAKNVISGYNRPYFMPNLFISDGKNNVFLKVLFDETFVEEVDLVFNTDLSEDIIVTQAKNIVKDYCVAFDGENYHDEICITDNYKRVNSFFPRAKIASVTVRFKENHGAQNFELFGVKIYKSKAIS